MKICTVFGTRPEIIRLSETIRMLDKACDQVLVHTGQNFDPALSDVFFDELNLRRPDVHLDVRGSSFAAQTARIIEAAGEAFASHKPDRLLLLGDTNSCLAAFVAARMRIPVYHLEAGNRCYDNRVPEEINRRVIDHCSDVLMPYTHRSKENLLREGIDRRRIYVVGNPIGEVLRKHEAAIRSSAVLGRLGLAPRQYMLATLHRAENVDEPARLYRLLEALELCGAAYELPVIVSVHPRTRERLRNGDAPAAPHVRFEPPFGLFDFAHLEMEAVCVLTDSGTVQEECCLFGVPNVTIRDVTERAETVEAGSNIISGSDPRHVLACVRLALSGGGAWQPPSEYLAPAVAATVARIVLGYEHGLN